MIEGADSVPWPGPARPPADFAAARRFVIPKAETASVS